MSLEQGEIHPQAINDYEDFLMKVFEVAYRLAQISVPHGISYLNKGRDELVACSSLHVGAGTGGDMFVACEQGVGVVHGIEISPADVALGNAYCQEPETTLAWVKSNPYVQMVYGAEAVARFDALSRTQLALYDEHQRLGREFLLWEGNVESLMRHLEPPLYDLIVCNLSLHYLCEMPWMLDVTLEGLARLLKPEGVLVFGLLGAMAYENDQQWLTDRREEGEEQEICQRFIDQLADTMGRNGLPITFAQPSRRITHNHYPLTVFREGSESLELLEIKREKVVTTNPIRDYLKGNPPRIAADYLGVELEQVLCLVPEVIKEMGEEAASELLAPWITYMWSIVYRKK